MLADHRLEQDRTAKSQTDGSALFTRSLDHAASVTGPYGPGFRAYFSGRDPTGREPRQDLGQRHGAP
jgi:hypothetical protein